jgi:hypothetical protein
LLQRSEEFDDAYWSKSGAGTGLAPVVTANAAISPRGDMTADLVAFDRGAGNASGDFSRLIRTTSAAVVNGSTYTGGVFIKAATSADVGRTIGFRHVGAGAYGVITLTAEWQRINQTEAAASTTLEFEISSRGTVTASNQVSVHLWGAQLELGSFASTYTPTVAATVTRPTDQVSYANFPQPAEIAARGGITVYHRFVQQGTGQADFRRHWQIGLGLSTANSRIFLHLGNAGVGAVFLGNGIGDTALTTNVTAGAIGSVVESATVLRYTAATDVFDVRYEQSVNGAAVTSTAFSSTISAAALTANGWQTAPVFHVGARDGGNDPGFQLNQALKARFGIHDLAAMRTLV